MGDNFNNDYLVCSARTDVGMRRQNNQDSYLVVPAATQDTLLRRGNLFVIADGMGAHAGGEVASRLAVETVSKRYYENSIDSIPDALRAAVLKAHETIKVRGNSDPSLNGMGTTCDSLVLTHDSAYVGHVGDSRVYRLRNHVLEQITFDHSVVWEVKHDPTAHAAYRLAESLPKNVITRSLGPTEGLVVALEGPFELRPGDVFLMCTDGLSGQLKDSEIAQILEILPPEQAVETLVNLAVLRGGPDNVTVIAVRVKKALKKTPEQQEAEKKKAKIVRPPLNGLALTALMGAIVFAALFILTLCTDMGAGKKAKALCAASAAAVGSSAAFLILARKTLFGAEEEKDKTPEKLGKAPYVCASAAIDSDFEEFVKGVCDDLCEVMHQNEDKYTPDWDGENGSLGVNAALKQAEQALKEKKIAYALRAHISVINYLMRQVRKYSDEVRKCANRV